MDRASFERDACVHLARTASLRRARPFAVITTLLYSALRARGGGGVRFAVVDIGAIEFHDVIVPRSWPTLQEDNVGTTARVLRSIGEE